MIPIITATQRVQSGRQVEAKVVSLPAPIGGWNARDQYAEMAYNDAVRLDNYIPGSRGVSQRRGYEVHATDLAGSFVESLFAYRAPASAAVILAACGTRIYNVTSAGAGVEVVTGLTNARWEHTMFSAPATDYLVICNGADAVRNFDGTNWTTPVITNVSSSALNHVCVHKHRLWFVESGTLNIWYLPTDSIAGAATKINFGPNCKKGGHLVCMATWTRDGGAGVDDMAVFITSEGEILIYEGEDPADADTWRLVGVFECPKPVGTRCVIKLGGDLCLLSEAGLLPLPQFLNQNSAGLKRMSHTDKISGAFLDAYRNVGQDFGWQVLEYGRDALLIVNIPVTERAEQEQYVMNLQTNAWCRFTGINAGVFLPSGDDLFFGGNDGKVYRYGVIGVYNDNENPIDGVAIQAFQAFGTPQQKTFTMARPLFTGPVDYLPQLKALVDFDLSEASLQFSPASYEEVGPFWNEELWNTFMWADGTGTSAKWQNIRGTGAVGAIALASSATAPLTWNQTDIGGIL
jgi:hypothetical protein